jgi:hypothetical protein
MWRSHEEGHTLLTPRSWAGALLATQGNARNVAAGKVARKRSVK